MNEKFDRKGLMRTFKFGAAALALLMLLEGVNQLTANADALDSGNFCIQASSDAGEFRSDKVGNCGGFVADGDDEGGTPGTPGDCVPTSENHACGPALPDDEEEETVNFRQRLAVRVDMLPRNQELEIGVVESSTGAEIGSRVLSTGSFGEVTEVFVIDEGERLISEIEAASPVYEVRLYIPGTSTEEVASYSVSIDRFSRYLPDPRTGLVAWDYSLTYRASSSSLVGGTWYAL